MNKLQIDGEIIFEDKIRHTPSGLVVQRFKIEHQSLQTEANLGVGVIINTSSSVDHNVEIDDGAHICPGVSIAGNVNIGKKSWVGIGTSIIQGINIGDDAIIGAGSVVINDIPDKSRVAGVPAKPI